MKRRSVTRPEVRVDGHWVSSFAPAWGELKHSTRTNGDHEASFKVTAPDQNWRHPALRFGALVEVYLGPAVVWAGTLDEPDWDGGVMTALGASRDGDDAIGFTAGGAATTKPNVAIDQAISRGVLPWTRVDDFGSTAVGQDDDAGGLVNVTSILNAWADENDSDWYVDQRRRLLIRSTAPGEPKWHVLPGSGDLGSAADERTDRVFVRYVSSTTGKLATASYPASTPASGIEAPVDITDRGVMTAAKATGIAQAKWNELQGQSGWTNGLTLVGGQVTTPGGVVADLSQVRAGDTIRLLNVPDPRGVARNVDVVIGETDYDWQEDQLQVNPVGLAARTEDAVLESVSELAADSMRVAASKAASGADSGWVNIPLASGYVAQAAGTPPRMRKVGDLVFVEGVVKKSSGSMTAGNNIIANLSSGVGAQFVKSVNAEWVGMTATQGAACRVILQPDGDWIVQCAAVSYATLYGIYRLT